MDCRFETRLYQIFMVETVPLRQSMQILYLLKILRRDLFLRDILSKHLSLVNIPNKTCLCRIFTQSLVSQIFPLQNCLHYLHRLVSQIFSIDTISPRYFQQTPVSPRFSSGDLYLPDILSCQLSFPPFHSTSLCLVYIPSRYLSSLRKV